MYHPSDGKVTLICQRLASRPFNSKIRFVQNATELPHASHHVKLLAAMQKPTARLLEIEREILLHVMAGRRGKEIGPLVGTSYDMVEKHIRNAKSKLGDVSRIEAARIVASEAGIGWVQNLDLQKIDLSQRISAVHIPNVSEKEAHPENEASHLRWPVPTKGNAKNELTVAQRWAWILGMALAFTLLCIGLVTTTGTLLDNLSHYF